MTTVQTALDRANPNELATALQAFQLGTVLRSTFLPVLTARTGIASSATQVHTVAGPILAVSDDAGTTALTVVTGTAGAGEVTVTYNATTGVATLVFGSGAVTGYQVTQLDISDLLAALDATLTGAMV